MSSSSAVVSSAIAVLIADSNRIQAQLLTSALRRRSEFHISTCQVDIASILQAVASAPKVVVLSLNHSVNIASQMAAMRRVHLSHPAVAKVLLVESYDRELVVSAFRSGARGIFCISDTHFRLLCRCIQRVAGGQIWANTEQMTFLLDLISEVPSLRVLNSSGHQLLTPREEQVVAEGLSNRSTARELNLSEHTIKKYLFRIFDKLGISSRVELVLYAVNHGDPLPAEWLGWREPRRFGLLKGQWCSLGFFAFFANPLRTLRLRAFDRTDRRENKCASESGPPPQRAPV